MDKRLKVLKMIADDTENYAAEKAIESYGVKVLLNSSKWGKS